MIPDLSNPQSWNRYSYVTNRPVNFNDPTGHAGCDVDYLGSCADWAKSLEYPDQSGGGSDPDNELSGNAGGNDPSDDEDPDDIHSGDIGYKSNLESEPPDYWDLNPSHPDYYTLALSYGIGNVTFTIDRYGQAYWAFGGSFNTSVFGGPPGISLMGGRIGAQLGDQPPGPVLSPDDMSSFLTGFAGNGDVGLLIGGGATFSPFSKARNQFGTYSTVAFDVGVSTPFAGGSVTYGFQFQNEKVNNVAQKFIESLVIPLLP